MAKKKAGTLEKLPGLDCGDCSFGSCEGMAGAIERGEAELKDCAVLIAGDVVVLKINEEKVPLNRFVQEIVKEVVLALVKPLKKAVLEEGDVVSIRVKFGED